MNNQIKVIEGFYESRYAGDPLWENVVKKLTIRQAYVFYYSLAFYEKNEIAVGLGIFDLPDKTVIHKFLMDTLLQEQNPKKTAQVISDNAHKILINDNDLLWIKDELRAALWLSYFVTKMESGGDQLLLDLLRSTCAIDFTERLTKVLDIYGCSRKGDIARMIAVNFNGNMRNLYISHSGLFNVYRGNYVKHRINDHKLNWLNKLSENEIDAILARFEEDKIQILIGIFNPNSKKDKLELIKASLNIQDYKYQGVKANESMLRPYSHQKATNQTESVQPINGTEGTKQSKNEKKDFANLGADEIIDLLKKALGSRTSRKNRSDAKNNRSLTLSKDAYSILTALSENLRATPRKTVEALIKGINLENKSELLKINENISGRRTSKIQLVLDQSAIHEVAVKQEDLVEPLEPTKAEEAKEVKTAIQKESNNMPKLKRNTESNWSKKRQQLMSKGGSKKH